MRDPLRHRNPPASAEQMRALAGVRDVDSSTRDRATAFDVLGADLLAVVNHWEVLAAVLRGRPNERVRVSEMAAVYERCASRARELVEEPIYVDELPATGGGTTPPTTGKPGASC